MTDPPNPEDSPDKNENEVIIPSVELVELEEVKPIFPHVTSFEETNQNFDVLSELMTGIVTEIKTSQETTNDNLSRMAEETTNNLNKLAESQKAILSSQTMMLTICIIIIMFVIVIAKTAYESINHFLEVTRGIGHH